MYYLVRKASVNYFLRWFNNILKAIVRSTFHKQRFDKLNHRLSTIFHKYQFDQIAPNRTATEIKRTYTIILKSILFQMVLCLIKNVHFKASCTYFRKAFVLKLYLLSIRLRTNVYAFMENVKWYILNQSIQRFCFLDFISLVALIKLWICINVRNLFIMQQSNTWFKA